MSKDRKTEFSLLAVCKGVCQKRRNSVPFRVNMGEKFLAMIESLDFLQSEKNLLTLFQTKKKKTILIIKKSQFLFKKGGLPFLENVLEEW